MEKGSEKQEETATDMELLLRTRDHHPVLYQRVMELLNIVHEPKTRKANDVEYNVIDNLRGMGKEALSSWARKRADSETEQLLDERQELKRSEKKTLLAYDLWNN